MTPPVVAALSKVSPETWSVSKTVGPTKKGDMEMGGTGILCFSAKLLPGVAGNGRNPTTLYR